MLFNSQAFILGFLPCVLAAYYVAAEHPALRRAVLVAASLVFYGWWDIRFVPLLVGLTLANWLFVRAYGLWRRDAWLVAGVVLNLMVLGVCKYANFAADTLASLFGTVHQPWGIVLPLGISFFTFQKISYLVDLRRGDRHVYGLLEFAAFVTFFPQLIAGPLVRHNEIIPQFALSPRRAEMWENLARGAVLFAIGLTKKAAIADTVAQICDPLFARGTPLNLAEAWAASGTYMLQIYFDFSGYSDMAIGLGLMFGLRLPLNFAAPYRAASIREFWRRWHMTLSRFLRDYLYIPLGGNRRGEARQALNVVATMLLGGLWHGAAWTFVVWGGLHGLALAANSAWDRAGAAHAAPARLGADDAVRPGLLGAVPRAGLHHGGAYPGGDGGRERRRPYAPGQRRRGGAGRRDGAAGADEPGHRPDPAFTQPVVRRAGRGGAGLPAAARRRPHSE
ncbi:MAG: MBOAT family protein [Acetobacteraceae bacterium]